MRFTRRSDSTLLEFPSYLVEIRHTDPFGITQLRLQDDTRLNLADGTLPLADWEWLWWTRLGQTQRRKLLQTDWGKPFIEAGEDWIRLHFTRHMKDHDIIVNVDMDFYDNLRFGVTYQVTNVGTQAVLAPYVMLGFPGFGNQRQTSLLGNDHMLIRMRPGDLADHARNLPVEQILLKQATEDGTHTQQRIPLRSIVHFGDEHVRLVGTFTPPPAAVHVEAAHVNKRDYLTSHLYVWLDEIPPNQSVDLLVEYEVADGLTSVPKGQQLRTLAEPDL